MRIILDAMGGDKGPAEFVKGAVLAAEELDVDIVLVGKADEIETALADADSEGKYRKNISVVDAGEVVGMNDDPVRVMKEKPDSSMTSALKLLADGKGDALVSSGNTGALLAQSTLILKRIKGVRRAALAPVLPTATGVSLLIDSGANVECTPEYLLQFAVMGSFYMKNALRVDNPSVGLLNNGTEEHKGDEMHREAYKLLKKAGEDGKINFIGNIEGRDGPLGEADVVVADGFSGNVYLKTMEGVGMFFARELKNIFMQSMRGKFSALMVKQGIQKFRSKMDYNNAGGAPLLGVRRPVIKVHGSSNATAICNAVIQAIDYIDSGMTIKLAHTFEKGDEADE